MPPLFTIINYLELHSLCLWTHQLAQLLCPQSVISPWAQEPLSALLNECLAGTKIRWSNRDGYLLLSDIQSHIAIQLLKLFLSVLLGLAIQAS